ncbi:MAG: 3-isopropylmalate dehydratase small subunit [Rickettsiales bacterium]|jgi:3-isopropylmalate/(R)-2-methylmalate dehydratase small subunit|nr:3-isopropylmalate dehydratase small subunit [Rickettsiales bacterium]|tara:strand:+ start:89633 stop:90235 length:603 start_codon:yes stop_codon:yes gene_type:complete
MEAFTTFKGIGIPIDIINCDTDQIIPARFLRKDRSDPDMHTFLWHDLRKDPNFVYNKTPYNEGTVVVADINWGCGSSREGAVYALNANGIRAVVAPSFGDIHYNNCLKWGVLPVRLSREDCDNLRQQLHNDPGAEIGFDLDAQNVSGPEGKSYSFEIDPFDKYRMLNGLDDFGVTREYDEQFVKFEAAHKADYGWLYNRN